MTPEQIREMQMADMAAADLRAIAWEQARQKGLDTETGAPPKVRMAVSFANKPEDQLETLKKYYPNSRFITIGTPGEEAVVDGISQPRAPAERKLAFENPDTGKVTIGQVFFGAAVVVVKSQPCMRRSSGPGITRIVDRLQHEGHRTGTVFQVTVAHVIAGTVFQAVQRPGQHG